MRMYNRNPVLSRLDNEQVGAYGETATFGGMVSKSTMLLAVVVAAAIIVWTNFDAILESGFAMPLLIGSMIIAFISILIASFSRSLRIPFSFIYAASEGVVLGAISIIYSIQFGDGIVINAITITFAIFAFLLVAYATGLFKVGQAFRKFVYTATFGLFFFMIFIWIIGIFSQDTLNFVFGANSNFAVIFILLVTLLSTFHLLLDFDNAKKAVDQGAPKETEWMISIGLLVSLVWLYINILRLLGILARRN